jgi:hypothetical protein
VRRTVRRRLALAAAAAGVAAAPLLAGALAGAEPSESQRFFERELLEDRRTGDLVKALLSPQGSGHVDRSIAFRDLTGDDKADAVVRIQSGGPSGAVAVYVFSTDGAAAGAQLRAVYRREGLLRAYTRVRGRDLIVRTARYETGDELCCPALQEEQTLRWSDRRRRFLVRSQREIAREDAAPSPTATPTPSPTATPRN